MVASLEDGGVACFNMALMYLRGQGVCVDFKKAIELMNRSANLGCANAMLYLGLAYILGYAYDPVEIECLSLIPSYRVIYKDINAPLLDGASYDPDIEDRRYEAIEADGDDAVAMYHRLTVEHSDDPYASTQCGEAKLMLGRAYIEGLGNHYDPLSGYQMIYNAAMIYGSSEAAQYLLTNAKIAKKYNVDVDKIELLTSYDYFRPITGNLGNSKSHTVPLMLPN